MESASPDREQQIAALLRLQGGITDEDLASAVVEAQADAHRSLLDVLSDRKLIDTSQRAELEAAVERFDSGDFPPEVESIGDDPWFDALRGALHRLGDNKAGNGEASPPAPADGTGVDEFGETVTAYGDASGRFAIIREHAKGGLGEVLLAQDQQLNRQVALKQIREQWADHPSAQERFLQEAEVTGRLEHPGVVPVHARGQRPDGRHYYAMRFIRGESLEEAIRRFHDEAATDSSESEHALQLRQLLTRFIDVCNTISYAHSRGIIHRDLKPANIMLGKYGETLVVDWGLAKSVGETTARSTKADSLITPGGSGSAPTQFGSAVGTPQYMSPEQATGRVDRIGPASDIYCLGATLFHLLTGKPPITDSSLERVLDRVEHGDFLPPREVNESVPPALSSICVKAMSLRPTDRYATAMDLAADLERWLADEPVVVYEEPLMARLGRWTRRHRALVASSVVAITLLGVSAVCGAVVWNHLQQQELRQELELTRQAQQRLSELTASTDAAELLAGQEMRAGRFGTALLILDRATTELTDNKELADRREELSQRADRVRSIFDFYRLSEQAEESNFLSRDTESLLSLQAALQAVGALDYGDWWAHLEGREDLTPHQFDELREAVYKKLLMLAGIYTKQVGLKLIGPGGAVERRGLFRAMMGSAGRDEAQAALIACDLVNRFRLAESARWYRGRVGRRFGKNFYLSPSALGPPRNSSDAQALAYLNLIAALDPEFGFEDYRGGTDPLLGARDTMQLAVEMDPDHYWSSLSMGHIDFLLAERAVEAGEPDAWRMYDAARQSLGRCIALRPDSPFAYADTSTCALHQAEAIAASSSLSEEETQRRQDDLRRLSLRNAELARDLAPDESWVYWHLGHALQAVGQADQAVESFLVAIERDHRLTPSLDAELVDPDDLRGRQRAIDLATELAEGDPDNPRYQLLLAAGNFSAGDVEAASSLIGESLALPDPPAMAWALRGLMSLDTEQFDLAKRDFEAALQRSPSSVWGAYGLGRCQEQAQQDAAALESFTQMLHSAVTDDHRAAAELGRCRTLLRLGDHVRAIDSLEEAKRWQPSCATAAIRQLAERVGSAEVVVLIDQLPAPSPDVVLGNKRLEEFNALPLLNGDFELELNRHWGNINGLTWMNTGECESTATITLDERHSDMRSLLISNDGTSDSSEGFGQTTQTVPSFAERRYRISLWAKADGLQTRAVRMVIDDGWETPVIELPAGTYDWTEFVGHFTTPAGDRATKDTTLVPTTVRLVCAGRGRALLDDISIVVAPSE